MELSVFWVRERRKISEMKFLNCFCVKINSKYLSCDLVRRVENNMKIIERSLKVRILEFLINISI